MRVSFELRPITESWPPVPSERLWALRLDDGRFRVTTAPWFVADIAVGDVILAATRNDDALWATERVESAGHVTIRLIPRKEGPLGGDPDAVAATLAPLGIVAQPMNKYGIMALDLPAVIDFSVTKSFLIEGATNGNWYFEEGCVNDDWIAS